MNDVSGEIKATILKVRWRVHIGEGDPIVNAAGIHYQGPTTEIHRADFRLRSREENFQWGDNDFLSTSKPGIAQEDTPTREKRTRTMTMRRTEREKKQM